MHITLGPQIREAFCYLARHAGLSTPVYELYDVNQPHRLAVLFLEAWLHF